jgi:tetratricopeptide (TPR) repeat protein
MHGRMPGWLAVIVLALGASPSFAQFAEDRPQPYVPKRPPTQKEHDQRASLHQYVLGLLCQREDRLLEALKAFEAAARLDPQAPAVFKSQVPLLLALERGADAAAVCRRALTLDPEDYETWFLAGRIHKSLGQFAEAQQALQRGLATEAVKERPDIVQGMWLELGTMHEIADETAPALKAFTAAAAILDHPDVLLDFGPFDREMIVARAAETYERIGNLYRKAKKYPEAIAAYQKAQQRSSDNGGRLNFNLAQLCQEEGKHAEALDYLDAYLRHQPLGTEAYEMKIGLLSKLNRTDDIIPWLEKASATDKYNLGVKLLLARQYCQEKRFPQAEKLYLALTEESPSEEAYQGLLRVYQQDAAAPTRALELLNRTIEQAERKPASPQSAHAATHAKAMIAALREDAALSQELVRSAYRQSAAAKDLHFDTLQLLAALADRRDLRTEAEHFYRQALRTAPPGSEPLLYGGLLRVLWKGQKYEEVLKLCQEGLAGAKATNHVLFHADIAKAQARLGRTEEAVRAADRAVALAGDNDRLTLQLLRIRILTQAERFVQAEKDCLALLKERVLPGDVMEIRYVLSNVYNGWKKLPQCEEQLGLILKVDPSNPTANNDLGYIWADQGKNLEKAEAMIRRALEMDRLGRRRLPGDDAAKDNAAYVDSLGWVLFRRGQFEEARRELERASELPDGDDPVIWDHLGDVYERQKKMSLARAAWEKAVQLYEQEHRRNLDDRYRELRRKLQSVTASGSVP